MLKPLLGCKLQCCLASVSSKSSKVVYMFAYQYATLFTISQLQSWLYPTKQVVNEYSNSVLTN